MHRTEGENATSGNLFTNGPPGTTVEEDWTNAVQEELAYVIEQAGLTLKTASTETRKQLKAAIDLIIAGAAQATDFSSKNLIINVQSNTTVDADADELSFINSSNILAFGSNINKTYDITTDKMGGTSEKASTWYQLWLDSAGVRMMVPDLASVADANVLNSLSDSAATFQTDLVQPDDEIYQLTDGEKGFVKAVSTENVITIKDKDGADLDLFPLGTENYKIRMLSPVGLGAFKARIGAAYNNASSHLDDSTYTQIQEEKYYYENGPYATDDFNVAGTNWTTTRARAIPRQVNDWTGLGSWGLEFNYTGVKAATSSNSVDTTISGILTKNIGGYNQAITAFDNTTQTRASDQFNNGYAHPNTDDIFAFLSSSFDHAGVWSFFGIIELQKKPSWAL